MTQLQNATLQEICTLVTDGTHDTPKTLDSGVPFIKAKQINDGIIEFADCEFISYEDHLKVISRSKPEKGDTLFAHIGASLGEAAYINTDMEFSIKNVALFKPDPQKIVPRYLYYLVINNEFQDRIKNRRTGSAQPFVSLDILRTNPIRFIEDIPTQRRIADMLSAYDDLIENNKRRIRILEQIAQAIYQEWFGKVDANAESLPKGWIKKKVGELAFTTDFVANGSFSTLRGNINLYDTQEYALYIRKVDFSHDFSGNLKYTDKKSYDFLKKSSLHGNEFIISNVGDTGTVFQAPVWLGKPMTLGSNSILVRSNEFNEYLFYYFNSNVGQYSLDSIVSGSAQPKFNKTDFRNLIIPIPDKSTNSLFVNFINPIWHSMNLLKRKQINLRQTRDLLLPRLVSGEIELK